MRRHGTTHQQPLVVFETLKKAALLDLPAKRAAEWSEVSRTRPAP
jgi:hypothetical protein